MAPYLNVVFHAVYCGDVMDAMRELASQHFQLEIVDVHGIPMKQKEDTKDDKLASRSTYSVPLFFSSSSSFSGTQQSDLTLKQLFQKRFKNRLIVRWKSVDRKLNVDVLPCKSVHRVTPFDVIASPTLCLMKHLVNDSQNPRFIFNELISSFGF